MYCISMFVLVISVCHTRKYCTTKDSLLCNTYCVIIFLQRHIIQLIKVTDINMRTNGEENLLCNFNGYKSPGTTTMC